MISLIYSFYHQHFFNEYLKSDTFALFKIVKVKYWNTRMTPFKEVNSMTNRISHSGLQIDKVLYDFVNNQALPKTGVNQDVFWQSFSQIIKILTPKNKALLTKRDVLQKQIDVYHKDNPVWDAQKYQLFLTEIGYLVHEIKDCEMSVAQ